MTFKNKSYPKISASSLIENSNKNSVVKPVIFTEAKICLALTNIYIHIVFRYPCLISPGKFL